MVIRLQTLHAPLARFTSTCGVLKLDNPACHSGGAVPATLDGMYAAAVVGGQGVSARSHLPGQLAYKLPKPAAEHSKVNAIGVTPAPSCSARCSSGRSPGASQAPKGHASRWGMAAVRKTSVRGS